MVKTRQYVAELVQRRFAGGDPSDDFQLKLEEINAWLDFGMAAAAMKSYGDTASLDTENIADGFYITHKNIALTADPDTGEYYASLPSMPLALPRGYDITGVYIEGLGKLSDSLMRIHGNYLEYFKRLRKPPNRIPYWIEGKQIRVGGDMVLDGKSIRVRMAGPSGGALTDDFNCPEDMLPFVVEQVYRLLMPTANVRQDLSNDGVNVQ